MTKPNITTPILFAIAVVLGLAASVVSQNAPGPGNAPYTWTIGSGMVPDPIVPPDGTQNVTGSLTASVNLTATTGDVTAGDDVIATDAVTGVSVTATTGNVTATAGDVIAGDDVTATGDVTGANLSGTNTGDQFIFQTIATTSGTNPVAETTADTLTLTAGTGITVTGDATTDTATIATTITQSSGANPTATVNGTAVNGAAVTFLRSDGAPALADPFTPGDATQNITGSMALSVDLSLPTSGGIIKMEDGGASPNIGTFTLVAGEVTVSHATIGPDWLVFTAPKNPNGVATPLAITVNENSDFEVAGAATDAGTYSYIIFDPSP